jgi:hypothetical protein
MSPLQIHSIRFFYGDLRNRPNEWGEEGGEFFFKGKFLYKNKGEVKDEGGIEAEGEKGGEKEKTRFQEKEWTETKRR